MILIGCLPILYRENRIISDTHLGYARFEDDAAEQAESAFLDATKADLILYAGDVF